MTTGNQTFTPRAGSESTALRQQGDDGKVSPAFDSLHKDVDKIRNSGNPDLTITTDKDKAVDVASLTSRSPVPDVKVSLDKFTFLPDRLGAYPPPLKLEDRSAGAREFLSFDPVVAAKLPLADRSVVAIGETTASLSRQADIRRVLEAAMKVGDQTGKQTVQWRKFDAAETSRSPAEIAAERRRLLEEAVRRGRSSPDVDLLRRRSGDNTYANVDPGDYRALRRLAPQRAGDMRMLGQPSISAAQIDQILKDNKSPAAKEVIRDPETGENLTFGQHLYKLGLKYGIDPAFALGFFKKESTFGKFGVARRTNSFGNIKGPNARGWRTYDSYASGATDWFKLVKENYVDKGRTTLASVLRKYAPSFENNTNGYIRNVASDMMRWNNNETVA